jgi:hypothetical protein
LKAMKSFVEHHKRWAAIAFILVLAYMGIVGCSKTPNPKDTVMDFFTALYSDDTAMVQASIDPERAYVSVENDLHQRGDSALTNIDWGKRLIASLTGDGRLRQRWLKTKIVINKTHFVGDSATVEVSFLDRETGIHFYNRMALVRRPDRWVIVAFRTM